MIEMTVRTLMKSLYDGDSNLTSLIFEDGDTKVMATGKDPEGSKDDENYYEDGYVWIIRSDAWARIDALPSAQPEPQWIPCSERLPEYDGEMYLVTDYCEQINRRRIHVSYCYVNREGFWSDVPLGYKVLAWMPLPEPYREGEQDENR